MNNRIPIIDLARVFLRPLESADAEDLLETYSDREAMKFRQNPPLETIEDARAMIETSLEQAGSGKAIRWGIEEKATRRVIGTFIWKIADGTHDHLIGYSLNKSWWHKGIMTEVVIAMVQYLFTMEDVTRLTATVNKANTRSILLLERCGFALEGESTEGRLSFRKEKN